MSVDGNITNPIQPPPPTKKKKNTYPEAGRLDASSSVSAPPRAGSALGSISPGHLQQKSDGG